MPCGCENKTNTGSGSLIHPAPSMGGVPQAVALQTPTKTGTFVHWLHKVGQNLNTSTALYTSTATAKPGIVEYRTTNQDVRGPYRFYVQTGGTYLSLSIDGAWFRLASFDSSQWLRLIPLAGAP